MQLGEKSTLNRLFLPSLCLAGLAVNVAGRTIEPLVTIISAEFLVGVATAAHLTSAYTLPFALGQPVLGPLGDMYGKTRILKISLLALSGSLLLAAVAPTLELLALARFCAGLAGGGVIPACMAAIGDVYTGERRQIAISRFITMNLLAQIFATSASGFIGEAYGWRIVILTSACIAIVAAIATRAMLPAEERASTQRFTLRTVVHNYGIVFRNPKAVLCYSTVFLEGVALFGILPYVGDILTRQSRGGVAEAGMVIGALGVGGLVYVLLVSRLLLRFTRYQFMAAGGVVMPAGPLALMASTPWHVTAFAFAITGFGFMLLHNSIQTEAVELAPDLRQSAYSLHALSFLSGQAAGPPLMGISMAVVGDQASLFLSACVLAGTGIVIAWLFRRLASEGST